ncbi:fused (3R)-hydroxyacyl-ACP dehydratase subunits HadA/HadB [Nocardia sp. CDC153]|uniref:fused (3R)-hydroxyacyl-ACP dehydratase subunits HadA/HadB n=1 Tax=Nocardia sp. CDC153 TaxID=3112167 RepID=UPI002DBCF926|nr:fused (3R)-hydroxyacyl-ACP dehydratase subunits HadA/HadB [Nocardia sp. CDC153]MEC3957734.1 fused (3R)-hydroxyacyl-ACP dehydratase subunits HadA/HadB [Nocardia sp. CDC153]
MTSLPETVDAAVGLDRAAHAQAMVGWGCRLEDGYVVNREKIREYARAVQDFHPVHWDQRVARDFGYSGLIATPTFASVIAIHAQARLFETLALDYGLDEVVQTDQVIEFHRPITAGDRLVCEAYLHSWRRAFGGDLLTTRTLLTDHRHRLVLETYTSYVARPRRTDAERLILDGAQAISPEPSTANSAPTPIRFQALTAEPSIEPATPLRPAVHARRFDEMAVGRELPPHTVCLTTGDLVNYAGVSGDTNPIHWDRAAAAQFGFDTVVAHGMLTLGLAAAFVTAWLGDPGALRGLSARMTSPVHVSDHEAGRIRFTGKVKSMDPATRTAVAALTAEHAGRRIFGRATATVQLA